MDGKFKNVVKKILAVALLVLPGSGLHAQDELNPPTGGDYTLRRSTVDSGGGESAGGEFAVRGTFGQADTGAGLGGQFLVRIGFWSTPGVLSALIFKDAFELEAGPRPVPERP